MSVQPRHATPRNLDRPTDGKLGAVFATMMGRPWKPYQRMIADVAGEKLPDGRYAYGTVIVLLPRQCGKTTVAYDVAMGRGLRYPDYLCRYSTHQGTITTRRFAAWFREIERVRPRPRPRMVRSHGLEEIIWPATQAVFGAFTARAGGLRSDALNHVVVDEAQEHNDLSGQSLDEMILPTLQVRFMRQQLWLVLTAGTDASTYARRYIDRALAGEPGVALFDFGCPDDVDPFDEALWPTWHPGLAHGLADMAGLRRAVATNRSAFLREYAGRWTRTAAGRVIPEDDWRSVQHTSDMPRGRLCLSIDVAFDRDSAAIGIGGPRRHIEIVDVLPVDEATERVFALHRRHGAPIAIDNHGPSATVHEELERAGADLLTMTSYDVAVATAGFLDSVKAHSLSIWPHPQLDEAVDVAGTSPLGDGFKWSARASSGSIAPLRAATFALWGLEHLPPEKRAPVAATS